MLSCRGGGGGGGGGGGSGGGGGVSCPGQFILPPPTWVSKYNIFANSTYFKLSECEDVSIINIIQVIFSCFLCRNVQYT